MSLFWCYTCGLHHIIQDAAKCWPLPITAVLTWIQGRGRAAFLEAIISSEAFLWLSQYPACSFLSGHCEGCSLPAPTAISQVSPTAQDSQAGTLPTSVIKALSQQLTCTDYKVLSYNINPFKTGNSLFCFVFIEHGVKAGSQVHQESSQVQINDVLIRTSTDKGERASLPRPQLPFFSACSLQHIPTWLLSKGRKLI